MSTSMFRPKAPDSATPPIPPGIPRPRQEYRTLVLGKGISVKGEIQDAERLVVAGMLEASSLKAIELAIERGGVVRGTVEVADAEISGLMDGALTVSGTLIVHASGKLTGETRCRRLQVEDGGQLAGQIAMITG
jgi:cytoskeletal protein CcmA (bactofilin family)